MDRSPEVAGSVTALVRLDLDAAFDAEVADRLTRQLRGELAALDVTSVRLAAAEAPPDGAKGADAVTIGAVVVAFSASGGVLATLLGTVRDWVARRSAGHRVVVTIDGDALELDAASPGQQRELVAAYLRRHGGQ